MASSRILTPDTLFDEEYYYKSKALQYYTKNKGLSEEQVLSDIDGYAAKIKKAFADCHLDAWTHYVKFGTKEGINPSEHFNTSAYMDLKLKALQANDPQGNWTHESMATAFAKSCLSALDHAVFYGTDEATAKKGEAACWADAAHDSLVTSVASTTDSFADTFVSNATINGTEASVATNLSVPGVAISGEQNLTATTDSFLASSFKDGLTVDHVLSGFVAAKKDFTYTLTSELDATYTGENKELSGTITADGHSNDGIFTEQDGKNDISISDESNVTIRGYTDPAEAIANLSDSLHGAFNVKQAPVLDGLLASFKDTVLTVEKAGGYFAEDMHYSFGRVFENIDKGQITGETSILEAYADNVLSTDAAGEYEVSLKNTVNDASLSGKGTVDFVLGSEANLQVLSALTGETMSAEGVKDFVADLFSQSAFVNVLTDSAVQYKTQDNDPTLGSALKFTVDATNTIALSDEHSVTISVDTDIVAKISMPATSIYQPVTDKGKCSIAIENTLTVKDADTEATLVSLDLSGKAELAVATEASLVEITDDLAVRLSGIVDCESLFLSNVGEAAETPTA